LTAETATGADHATLRLARVEIQMSSLPPDAPGRLLVMNIVSPSLVISGVVSFEADDSSSTRCGVPHGSVTVARVVT
jgi:hypothetical protein